MQKPKGFIIRARVCIYLPVWRHLRARWRSQLDRRSRRKKNQNLWANRRNNKRRTVKKKPKTIIVTAITTKGNIWTWPLQVFSLRDMYYSTKTTRMNPYTFFFLLDYNIWPAKAVEMSKCFPSTTTTPTSSSISRPRIVPMCVHSVGMCRYVHAYTRLTAAVKEKRNAVVFKLS